ncbi:hypothetical protein [Natranaerofaba carboxydovora]|uniref:hypothetical protein n=1 Tax=Natranaerofaba carboxydovora TaxID=2742683 RepID=UPI001F13B755|nr:hypothetical protein [Natranaerofaba carboxydovora]UMZ73110.1 hypothetical protein ACONDI_00661 [Natranaerofaba carboxydovora]
MEIGEVFRELTYLMRRGDWTDSWASQIKFQIDRLESLREEVIAIDEPERFTKSHDYLIVALDNYSKGNEYVIYGIENYNMEYLLKSTEYFDEGDRYFNNAKDVIGEIIADFK